MECPRCEKPMIEQMYGDDEGSHICINCGLSLTLEDTWELLAEAISLLREWPTGHQSHPNAMMIYRKWCGIVDG